MSMWDWQNPELPWYRRGGSWLLDRFTRVIIVLYAAGLVFGVGLVAWVWWRGAQ